MSNAEKDELRNVFSPEKLVLLQKQFAKLNKQVDHCVKTNNTHLEMMVDVDLHPHVIPVISEVPSK